jgi:hypothetical protein
MRRWYYARQGQRYGPYSPEQLRDMARAGRLLPEDLVVHEGAGQWVQARTVPGLFGRGDPVASPGEPVRGGFIHTLLALPRPLLFALCGALGGLLGALLIGEPLWAVLSPAGQRAVGPRVRLALPDGLRVYTGGTNRLLITLARDSFDGPIEVEAEDVPAGIAVKGVTVPDAEDEAELDVSAGKEVRPGRYRLAVRARSPARKGVHPDSGVVELSVEPLPVRLALAASPHVSVNPGGKARFTIKLARSNFDEPVVLGFKGAPAGVTLAGTVVPAGQTEVQLEAGASREQPAGSWPVSVEAAGSAFGSRVTASASFTLQVLPVSIPQADILFVLDLTGSMQFAIDGIKAGILDFVKQLETREIDARVGMVGFRDIEEDRERPFVLDVAAEPFTKDYRGFRARVAPLRAGGGWGRAGEQSAGPVAGGQADVSRRRRQGVAPDHGRAAEVSPPRGPGHGQ